MTYFMAACSCKGRKKESLPKPSPLRDWAMGEKLATLTVTLLREARSLDHRPPARALPRTAFRLSCKSRDESSGSSSADTQRLSSHRRPVQVELVKVVKRSRTAETFFLRDQSDVKVFPLVFGRDSETEVTQMLVMIDKRQE